MINRLMTHKNNWMIVVKHHDFDLYSHRVSFSFANTVAESIQNCIFSRSLASNFVKTAVVEKYRNINPYIHFIYAENMLLSRKELCGFMTYCLVSTCRPSPLFHKTTCSKVVMNVRRQIEKSSAVIVDSPPNPGAHWSHSSPRKIYSLAGPSRKLGYTSFRREFLQVLYWLAFCPTSRKYSRFVITPRPLARKRRQ